MKNDAKTIQLQLDTANHLFQNKNFYKRLRGYAFKKSALSTYRIDRSEIDDILHESISVIYNEILKGELVHTYNTLEKRIMGAFYKAVSNTFRRYLKHQKRLITMEHELAYLPITIYSPDLTIENIVTATNQVFKRSKNFPKGWRELLSPKQGECFSLYYNGNYKYSYKQIAGRLKISANTIGQRMHEAYLILDRYQKLDMIFQLIKRRPTVTEQTAIVKYLPIQKKLYLKMEKAYFAYHLSAELGNDQSIVF